MAIIDTLKSLIFLLPITNTSIALATVILEQVLNNVVFECPCITDINFIYGSVFLLVPAIVLFVLGYVLNPKTWIFFTGCCGCCKRTRTKDSCFVICVIFFRALVAPLSWISIGLFDGEYYACAMTKRPYNQSCDVVNRGTEAITYSAEYHKQMAVSRLIGWFTVAGSFIFGALVYTVYRCCCVDLDHWRHENSKWKETIREDVFQKLVKEEIEEKGKVELRKYFEDKSPEAIFKFFEKHPTDEEYEKVKKVKTDKEKKNPEEMKTDKKKNNPEQMPLLQLKADK